MDFEQHREHLLSVAYRILGSYADAEDAVHEAWLRMNRADTTDVGNGRGWLTTVVARISLDMLRARTARREEPLDDDNESQAPDPQEQAVLADSVGVALMVVLQALPPNERLALVLHDVFDVPFAEIGPIIDRSPNATAQLAVRARRRVRGQTAAAPAQRRVVEAFLAAARDGEFDALLILLHPDVQLRADAVAAGGHPFTVDGAHEVAGRATMFAANAAFAEPALVDGDVGVVVAPDGQLKLVLRFAVDSDVITGIDIEADPDRLAGLDVRVLS